MSEIGSQCGWVRVHHPSGLLVTLPVPSVAAHATDHAAGYKLAFAAVGEIIAAGFLVNAPGLEDGEQKQECLYVVRKSKDNDRGGVTTVIDMYPSNEAAKFSFLTIYLNNEGEQEAFESATGLRVNNLPKYVGDNKIERGKKRDLDELVVKAPKPFGVVYIANPKYNAEEAAAAVAGGKMYPIPKRKFVRWADAPAPGADNGHAEPHPTDQGQQTQPAPAPQQDKVADELPTVERLCSWYTRATAAQVAGLEGYRKRMWFGATDSEKVAMTAASDNCKQRLGMIGGPEKQMGSHDGGDRIPF